MDHAGIYAKLMEISESIGELKALASQTNNTLTAHIADDKAIAVRTSALEALGNRTVGAYRVVVAIGTFVGGVGGILGSLFVRHH